VLRRRFQAIVVLLLRVRVTGLGEYPDYRVGTEPVTPDRIDDSSWSRAVRQTHAWSHRPGNLTQPEAPGLDHVLNGKVVIITGASSGIGAETARQLSRLGCRLTLAGRSEERLRALADELDTDALAVRTDVTASDDVRRMVDMTIERFGRIDVMFANAGIYIPGKVDEGDPAEWSNLMNVNIDGVLNCVHAVLGQMKAQGSGDILVTSSISGFVDIAWEPIYSASKHAIQGFVHTLRRQVAPMGLRVGAIAPGAVATELWGLTDPDEIARLADHEHSFIRAEDVARAVIFMLSQPPYVTIRDLVILPQGQDI
jgi:ribitol 2-dehydrogenase